MAAPLVFGNPISPAVIGLGLQAFGSCGRIERVPISRVWPAGIFVFGV